MGDIIASPRSSAAAVRTFACVRAIARHALFAVALAIAPVGVSSAAPDEPLLIFAAASLKPALDEVLASPAVRAVGDVKASYAASSQLAKQIESGAPASVFISADRDWMDYLAQRHLIVDATRADWLGNALVLIAPTNRAPKLTIAKGFDLAGALGKDGRLSLAEPNSVPAGKYAKAALTALGVWDSVADRVVSADNVRGALNFVAKGEAPLGIVYRTDAMSEPAVVTVATFPDDTHAPIVYPIALVAGHDSAATRKLIDALRAPEATQVFKRSGFDVLAAPR